MMAFLVGEYVVSINVISNFSSVKNELQTETEAVHKAEPGGIERLEKTKLGNGITSKATKGVIAGMADGFTNAGSVIKSSVDSAKKIIEGREGLSIFFTLLGLVLNILWLLFGKYILTIGERRFFMENVHYSKTQVRRVLLLYKEKKLWNPAKVMFMRSLFLILWGFTVIGGIIKLYSYKMVPYILAENPNIRWKDAIKLSRDMMNGNKRRAFLIDLSFWYWYALAVMTLGILAIFFVNPYYRSVETRLYSALRAEGAEAKILNIDMLNDDDLYCPEQGGSDLYPGLVTKVKKPFIINYKRNYSIMNLILFFFTFSFVGWIWEVSIHLVRGGVFVDRGTMYGPWLPIYGAGGLIILVGLKKFREKPWLNFILTMVVCGIVEYVTSYILQATAGMRWWDYSGYFLNINGRICLEGLLVFAIGGTVFVYILAPLFDDLYNRIPNGVKIPVIAVLLAAFTVDFTYSHFHPNHGKGITDYGIEGLPKGKTADIPEDIQIKHLN
ncbi:MAG: DUF975 family protein [Eubacteriaceae bacterium]|nr:DUF975 family protein [Eubacteriaceae bacterium]